jgi:sarcosine oxidase subunit beta
MTNTADVIIIGAGVHGASLAYHLAERGVKALVLEKNFVAAGATGRSSGLVRMHYDVRQDSELAWVSFQYFTNWAERVGGDAGFRRTGFLQFVGPEFVEAMKANVKMHQQIGIPAMIVKADDVKRLAPTFASEDVEVAAFEPESGYADPTGTANAFLNAARAKGARLIQDCAVTGIKATGGRVAGVVTAQGEFSAPIVVNAAGAWAGKLNQMAGLNLPYDTWRHDTMFVARPRQIGPSHPTVIDFANEMYFRPEGNLTLVGLEDGNPLGESPDGDTDHAQKGFVERGIDRICRRIPIMENGALHSAHGGYDGITPDQHAMLGQSPFGPQGFYLDCGHSGTGFKISPAVGLCMSELILDGKAKTVDISIYSPSRFTEGKHIVGEHSYSSIWH